MAQFLFRLLAMTLTVSLVGGCGSAQKSKPPVRIKEIESSRPPDPMSAPTLSKVRETTSAEATEREADGDFQASARIYQNLAARSSAPLKYDYLLHAATALLRGNFVEQASRALDGMGREPLSNEQHLRRRLLLGRIALILESPDRTLSVLGDAPDTNVDPVLRAQYHQIRAEAFSARANAAQALAEFLLADAVLVDLASRQANQGKLWQMLTTLTMSTLRQLYAQTSDETTRGWIELATMYHTHRLPTIKIDQALAQWRTQHPAHPANEQLLQSLLALQSDRGALPKQIAVLLPSTGPLAKSAQAIQDGLLAAYFRRENREFNPTIRFYNVGDLADQTLQVYQLAAQNGADFIVGPLAKEGVNALAAQESLTVPTLALNFGAVTNPLPKELYQFALAPEDEAQQVAQRAWADGHNQAIVIYPDTPLGQRLFGAFQTSWESTGGTVIESESYKSTSNDFSQPLVTLLNIEASRERRKDVAATTGIDVKFEPHRRRDIDFIFVAATPQHARQIRPQLKFFYAADLPIYATSHVYTGVPNPAADTDMDDILFCDTPFTLSQEPHIKELWRTIEQLWPKSAPAQKRLYALGYDSFNIITQLHRLAAYGTDRYRGFTGMLYMDENHQIHRELLWAKFVGGKPELVEKPDYF